ncbi:MAG TPA: thiamine pyrophosphate-binding protein [Bacillota bacterium]|nr:thiamine pyrophosphate-binding protein [Bacillota bacterium]
MKKEFKTVTAAQAIVETMKREQIEKVFCVPGESYLPVLDALHDESSIQVISARHEGGAAFMAEGYAKSNKKPGIVLATRGVGAANLSIGVHTAYQDSTPMIVLLGQVHSKFRGREGFQEVDLDQFFQPISKWAVEVSHPERMAEIMQRAFRVATSGRPGPVVISLPEDVLPVEAEMMFTEAMQRPAPVPSIEEVERIEQLLENAKKPLIIAGGGVKSAGGEEILVKFAEKYHLPVMASFRRHDVFPNEHPLYAGHFGLGMHAAELQTIKEADVVFAIGSRLSEVTTQDYSIITPDKKLIHIDISYDTLGKVFVPDVGIIADAKEALEAMKGMDLVASWTDWAASRNEAYKEAAKLEVSEDDVINKHVISILEKTLPDDALLTTDAGNFAGWLHSFYPFKKKNTFLGPTSGAMGYGMPAAIGAKLAFPDKTVVSLSGDGGYMMTGQELETAVRYNVPVISLVFNNEMYGTIRMHQEMHYPEKVVATDLGRVSFVDMAKSFGADGYFVETKEQFQDALDKAIAGNKPALIEIATGKEQISVGSTITEIRESCSK